MHQLTAVDYQDPDAADRFAASLRETGFGVLKNHPIDENQVQGIYRQWLTFFASDEKHELRYDPVNYDGFFPIEDAESAKGHSVRDLKEYFHFYLWGRCPEALRSDLTDYYTQTVEFAKELLSWVENGLPDDVRKMLSEPLSSMMQNSQQSLLRILHYPPLPDDVQPGAIRANAHEDINLLTILPASNEPGLQVMTKEREWLDVPCDFGNLIINSGDMLQEATQFYYPSTTHRVVNPEGSNRTNSRISLPLFLHPRPDVVLSKRYTAQAYRDERLAELRNASASTS